MLSLRAWTIQPLSVWERLQLDGIILVNPSLRTAETSFSLKWLVNQLQTRVSNYEGHLPWWAYDKKPDLRVFRHRLYGPQVRIELKLPKNTYLRFPSWAWHRIFTWKSLDENDQLEIGEVSAPPPSIVKSWERLFQLDLPTVGYDEVLGDIEGCEVVFETLKLANVVCASKFVGCNPQLKEYYWKREGQAP